jgi:hypothetical protein
LSLKLIFAPSVFGSAYRIMTFPFVYGTAPCGDVKLPNNTSLVEAIRCIQLAIILIVNLIAIR